MALSDDIYQVSYIFISRHVNDIYTAQSINILPNEFYLNKQLFADIPIYKGFGHDLLSRHLYFFLSGQLSTVKLLYSFVL